MSTYRFNCVAIAILIAAAVVPVVADEQVAESRILSDHWYISLGGTLTTFKTEASIGFGTALGSFIRIEDDLDLDDDQNSFRFNGIYAFNGRHALDFTFTDYSRNGDVVINEEIKLGDDGDEVVFEVGANVATRFDSTNFKLFYKYSFVNTGKTQAGIGAGISVFDYFLELEGNARVDDDTTEFTRIAESLLAPIPSLLMFINHAVTPRLIFRMVAGFFDITIGDIEGGLVETRLTLDYFITKHFSVGGGFEGSNIDFRDRGEDPLTVEIRNQGLIFYVAGAF